MAFLKGLPENQTTAKQSTSRNAPPDGGAAHYGDMMESAGAQQGIPAGLMSRLISKETGGQADPTTATSSAGAYGLGQVLPDTARDMGYTDEQMQDPYYQAEASAKYLRQMYDRYGTWRDALQAYHDGPGNHDKNLAGTRTPGPEGAQYVDERFYAYTQGNPPATDQEAPQHATSAKAGRFLSGNSGNAPAAAQQAPTEAHSAAPDDEAAQAAAFLAGKPLPTPQQTQPAAAGATQPDQPTQQQPNDEAAQAAAFLAGKPLQPTQPTAPAAVPATQQQPASPNGDGFIGATGDLIDAAIPDAVKSGAASAGRAIIGAGTNIARPVWNWAAGAAEDIANTPMLPGGKRGNTVFPRIDKSQDAAISKLEGVLGAEKGSLHTQGVGEELAADILPYFVGPGELKILRGIPGGARFVVNSLFRNAVGSASEAAKTDDEFTNFLKNEAQNVAFDKGFQVLGKVLKPKWEAVKSGLGFGTKAETAAEETAQKSAGQAADNKANTTLKTDDAGGTVTTEQATAKLASQLDPNMRVIRAAEDLGMADKLTPAHYAQDTSTRQVLANLQKSTGGKLEAKNIEAVTELTNKADDMINMMGGTKDKAAMSGQFKEASLKVIDDLETQSNKIYNDIRAKVPEGADVEAPATLAWIKQLQKGQRVDLSPAQKAALKRLTPKTETLADGSERVIKPSYEALDQMRREVGQAMSKNTGPFKDSEEGMLKKLYGTITDDQEAAAKALGVDAQWNVAKALVAQRKTLEEGFEKVAGKSGEGVASVKYAQAIQKLRKGDYKDWDQITSAASTPPEMRTKMVSSALHDVLTAGARRSDQMNVAGFTDWYEGARKAGTLSKVTQHLTPAGQKALHNVYTVASAMRKGNTGETTGKYLDFANRFNDADGPMARLFGPAMAGLGAAAGGLPGMIAGQVVGAMKTGSKQAMSRVDAANEVLSDPKFLDVVKAAARQSGKKADIEAKIAAGTANAADLAEAKAIRTAERKMEGTSAMQRLKATMTPEERAAIRKLGFANWFANGAKQQANEEDQE